MAQFYVNCRIPEHDLAGLQGTYHPTVPANHGAVSNGNVAIYTRTTTD
jgi:hypothetical protein